MNSLRLLAALAVSSAALGCSPGLSLVTPAAPARIAEVSNEPSRIELTEGTALAAEAWYSGVCRNMTVTTANPKVARVLYAHMNSIAYADFGARTKPSGVAVIGGAPGSTKIYLSCDGVWSGRVTNVFAATVHPSPKPTAAR